MDVVELLPRLYFIRLAFYLPRHRVLFTGDAVARGRDGAVIGGVFNVNRPQAAA